MWLRSWNSDVPPSAAKRLIHSTTGRRQPRREQIASVSRLSESGLRNLLSRLAARDTPGSEADIAQADVRQLLLSAPFQLDESDVEVVHLESPLGDRRRIDVEIGSTVIEVKRDLRRGRVKADTLGRTTCRVCPDASAVRAPCGPQRHLRGAPCLIVNPIPLNTSPRLRRRIADGPRN